MTALGMLRPKGQQPTETAGRKAQVGLAAGAWATSAAALVHRSCCAGGTPHEHPLPHPCPTGKCPGISPTGHGAPHAAALRCTSQPTTKNSTLVAYPSLPRLRPLNHSSCTTTPRHERPHVSVSPGAPSTGTRTTPILLLTYHLPRQVVVPAAPKPCPPPSLVFIYQVPLRVPLQTSNLSSSGLVNLTSSF